MKQKALYYFVFALSLIGCSPSVSDIYITADKEAYKNGELVFVSINEAMGAVAQLRKEGNKNTLTLHLMEGEYRISAPIRITAELGPLHLKGEGEVQ